MNQRSGVTWWLAGLIAVVLAVIWTVPLVLLFLVWFFAIPLWLVFVLVLAGICFAFRHSWSSARTVGFGVLGSVPLTVALLVSFLAVAT